MSCKNQFTCGIHVAASRFRQNWRRKWSRWQSIMRFSCLRCADWLAMVHSQSVLSTYKRGPMKKFWRFLRNRGTLIVEGHGLDQWQFAVPSHSPEYKALGNLFEEGRIQKPIHVMNIIMNMSISWCTTCYLYWNMWEPLQNQQVAWEWLGICCLCFQWT